MTENRFRMHLSDLLKITAGTALMAAAANLFFSPAGMVPGGFTGLAMLLERLTAAVLPQGLPLWLGNLLLNIPLIILSVRIRGRHFVRATLAATLLFSAWLWLIPEYPLAGDDLFLTAVIGGAVMGAGLGLVFFGKATTGGTDTLAAIIQHALPHLSAARILPVLDGTVIFLSVWIFGLRVSLYAALSVWLTGRVADGLITGFRNACLAYIITDRWQEVSDAVMSELDRGTTLLEGTGMYTTSPKPVLFCAVSHRQAVLLKEIVCEADPKAFMILTDASEIRGEGFLAYSKEEF